MAQSKFSYIDTTTAPTSYVNANSANLAAVTTAQQITDLETQLSDSGTGLVARVIHISGNYVKVKWFLNKKPVGLYKARGHTLAQATSALEYYKVNALATPTSAVASVETTTDDATVAVAGTAQLTLTATLASAATVDVTTKGYYTMSPTGKATITAAGVFTGVEGNVKASQTLTSDATNVAADETVTIGNKVYTFKTTPTTVANEVKVGADAATSLANLKKAINLTGVSGTDYGSATVAHTQVDAGTLTATTLLVTAKVGGTQANSYATTETSAHLSWGAATLAGGTTQAVVVTGAYGGQTDDVTITVG